jgi:hypothetical protein
MHLVVIQGQVNGLTGETGAAPLFEVYGAFGAVAGQTSKFIPIRNISAGPPGGFEIDLSDL